MTDAELAKAVADACGIILTPHDGQLLYGWGNSYGEPYDPANEWQAAMRSAEACGLFDRYLLGHRERGWVIFEHYGLDLEYVTHYNSGPRAICEAILAVKGVKE